MKKVLISTLFASASLFSASSAFASSVELVNAWKFSHSRYGMSSYEHSFKVEAADIGNEKQVYIHRIEADGSWIDIPLRRNGYSGEGKDLWVGSSTTAPGARFAIKYVVDGQTYWGNNNGNDYPITPGYILGENKNVSVGVYYTNSTSVSGRLAVRNLGYHKDIRIVYSNDNWQTSQVIQARWGGSPFSYGYGSHQNPNLENIETWIFNGEVGTERGQFFVEYTVDGQTYYDNNLGNNYVINPNSTYETMFIRTSGSGWEQGVPMSLVNDNVWSVSNLWFGEGEEFKFDAQMDWLYNYGDNEADFIAEPYGANITPEAGIYNIEFNDLTKEYKLYKR